MGGLTAAGLAAVGEVVEEIQNVPTPSIALARSIRPAQHEGIAHTNLCDGVSNTRRLLRPIVLGSVSHVALRHHPRVLTGRTEYSGGQLAKNKGDHRKDR